VCSRKAPLAVEEIQDATVLQRTRLGIDAPVLLCRACSTSSDAYGYLSYLVGQLSWLSTLQCEVLFVFDGPGHRAYKQPAHASRDSQRARQAELLRESEAALSQAEDLSNWDAILECRARRERHARACFKVSDREREAFQMLLCGLGWTWCTAPAEAEAYLSALQLAGHLDYAVTEDSDAIVCGSPCIIRNFWSLNPWQRSSASAGIPQFVRSAPVLAALTLSEESLRAVAVLAGCDFAPKLPGVGLARALAAVRKCGQDLPSCLVHLRCRVSEEDLVQLERALRLLQAPRTATHRAAACAAPSRVVLNPRGLRCAQDTGVTQLVSQAEGDGELYELRDLLLRERPAIPTLVPLSWTAPRM
jgi:5'-3' exonuclease